jgi:formylglycine-generating enzyme required for sulfatase activity
VVGIVILYVAGVGIYRWRLKVSARAPTAQYETAMVRMGIAGEAVRVEGFRLDLHEVSAAQYRLCYQAKACDPPIGIPDYREIALSDEEKLLPVVEVTMFNARDYCEWQGGRLPTVAEWEYAVRGTTYRTWPWGEEKPTRAHANVDLPNNRGPQPFTDSLVSVQDPAYSKGRTPEGVWHLLGNAWEWTSTLITGCPHDAQGRFSEVHLCKTWNGDDSASGLFAAGLSYNHQLLPGDEQRVSEHINVGATIFGDDLGFRCAYDVP